MPEQSKGIRKHERGIAQWVADWSTRALLAASAASSDGVDVWIDLHMADGFFGPGRSKSAITTAGIRLPGMNLYRRLVVA